MNIYSVKINSLSGVQDWSICAARSNEAARIALKLCDLAGPFNLVVKVIRLANKVAA